MKDLPTELVRGARLPPSESEIASALSVIPDRYRMVVTRAFGYEVPFTSVSDLAKEAGVTYERIRTIRNIALARMRKHLRSLEDQASASQNPPI